MLFAAVLAALTVSSNAAASNSMCWSQAADDLAIGLDLNTLHFASAEGDYWAAWTDSAALHVAHLTRGQWLDVSPSSAAGVYDPMLGLNAAMGPVLFSRSYGTLEIARRLQDRWVDFGDDLRAERTESNADDEDLALDSSGRPTVAWIESHPSGPKSLFVSRWNGTHWFKLGGAISSGVCDDALTHPVMVLDRGGEPWVAWQEDGRDRRPAVHVARWNGERWLQALEPVEGDGIASAPSLASTVDGRIVLVWEYEIARRSVVVVRAWNGNTWKSLPSPLTVPSHWGIWSPHVVADARGGLLLAFRQRDESDIASGYLESLDHGVWKWMLYGIELDDGQSEVEALEVRPSPGGLFVVWAEPDAKRMVLHSIYARACAPGEAPSPFPVSRRLQDLWPKTVDEAVEQELARMTDEDKATVRSTKREDLILFHLGWGMGIRNRDGLWCSNGRLLHDCGTRDPEECSMKIIERVWQKLQAH